MSDKLDAEIEKARQEYWEAEEKAVDAVRLRDVAEARLDALALAASLRPPATLSATAVLKGTGTVTAGGTVIRGRQPGAISKSWRSVLLKLFESHRDGATEDVITEVARAVGLVNTRIKDAHDRMTEYQLHGYVEPAGRGWRVTDAAIAKFSASTAPPPMSWEVATDNDPISEAEPARDGA